ncbi:hypothetical protein AQUCO_04600025v1 [Aquilegia coerulea]|uniref:Uncharacterized protein n=1 Tax=Aquilegia coerulea TaxID=218851 RepID=A0A2G5CLB7_AQUCA|nr:hypothetical protein AQUCO_04600025v1 [Aquilegia coerulea]
METNQISSLHEDDSSFLLLQEEEEFTINLGSNINTTTTTTTTTLDLACSPLLVPPNPNPRHFTKVIEPCHEDTIVEKNINEQTLSALKSTDESIQLKRRKKRGNFNLRKSLAWNNAFFTEEGVLNQQELAILSGSHNKFSNMFLSDIPEEGTNSLQEDPISRGLDLQDSKGKFSYTSPLRPVNKDVKFSAHSSPKVNSALGSNSKTPRKLELVKGVNKTPFKAGGCPRPPGAASYPSLLIINSRLKRLPSMNIRDVPKKDMKIPKLSVSRPEQSSVSAMPKISARAEKNTNNNRNRPVGPAGSLSKNALPKAFSNTSKTTSICKSLTTKSSIHCSKENTASKASTGLKVLSDSVQIADASTSKVAISLPQNTQYSCGKATDLQIHMTKPSGLRMPSPSLRYFAQTQASTCPSVSAPKKTQSCNFRGVGIPSLRKTGDSYNDDQMKPVHEPAVSLKTSERGISSMKSLSSTTATTMSHPSLKLNKGHQRVVERSQASDHMNSKIELSAVSGAEYSLEHQQGETQDDMESIVDCDKVGSSELPQSEEQAENQNCISHEVEKVQHKENHISIDATNFSYPSLKLSRELQGSAEESLQVSDLMDLEMHTFADDGANNMLEHQKLKEEQDLKNMGDSYNRKAVSSELLPQAEQTEHKNFGKSAMETLQVSHLGSSEMKNYAVGEADNSSEHQKQKEFQEVLKSIVDIDNRKEVNSDLSLSKVEVEHKQLSSHEGEKIQLQDKYISQENSNRLIESKTSEQFIKNEEFGSSRCNERKNNILFKDNDSYHFSCTNRSDSELKCELENSVQSSSTEQLQKVDRLEDLINVRPGNEELNASESRVLPLVDSEMQSYIVSGADYLIEHKNGEELRESLKVSSSVVDIDRRKSVVYNDGKQEGLKIAILENVQFEESHIPQKNNGGFIEPDNTTEKSVQDNDLVNYSGKEPKNNISSKHSETTELSHNKASDVKSELPSEDTKVLPLKRKSLDDCRQNALILNPKLNAAPFSDEWLAALEEVGEEILTMKTGAVQNSPPDKSLPEPGPWSPVKRKKNVEIGPFDCTKYTNVALPQLE